MKFCKLEELKKLVELKAKYQKVLLAYDDTISSTFICNLYEEIKELCVFNKKELNKLDNQEINNGYKLLIFCCSADNFLQLNLDIKDFINIFVPTNKYILPFFVQDNGEDNYLILQDAQLDITILFSFYFNKFYAYLKNLLNNDESFISINFDVKNINQQKLINLLTNEHLEFEDLKIIKKCNLNLSVLPAIDYILLFAFLFFFQAIFCNNLSMVDIYKSMKEDYDLIDKYFLLATNKTNLEIIKINYYELTSNLNHVIKLLNNFVPCVEQLKNLNDEIILKLKNYSKQENCLFNLLFLFKAFGD